MANFVFAQRFFDKVIQDHLTDSAGCVVLVAKNGQIIYEKAFGKANIELDVPCKTDMIFEVGSVSKQFASVAILQLMEKGKLALNDDISIYFPDFPQIKQVITIEHLLTHTSGITDDVKEFDENESTLGKLSVKEQINLFKNIPVKFEAGTQMSYSNPAYLLLGCIIEKVTGESYETYIRKSFLNPLKMTSAYFTNEKPLLRNKVQGYEKNKDNAIIKCRTDYTKNSPAGGLQMTVSDY